jgi:hypothetical protein
MIESAGCMYATVSLIEILLLAMNEVGKSETCVYQDWFSFSLHYSLVTSKINLYISAVPN